MENEMMQKYQTMKLFSFQAIGKILPYFAKSIGISCRRYYKLLAAALQYQLKYKVSAISVKRYTTRGIPQKLTYSDLSAAIEQVFQDYINDPKRTQEEIALAKKAHEDIYPTLLSTVKGLYESVLELEECIPYINDDVRMQLIAELFYTKQYFEEGKSLSKEEADLLVESVRRYSYKDLQRMKKKNKTR